MTLQIEVHIPPAAAVLGVEPLQAALPELGLAGMRRPARAPGRAALPGDAPRVDQVQGRAPGARPQRRPPRRHGRGFPTR